MLTYFIRQYLKISFLNMYCTTHCTHQKIVKENNCQTHDDRCILFPTKSEFLWKLKFYHWQQMLSVVYLGLTDSLHSFFKQMSATYLNLKDHSLSFFQVKLCLMKITVWLLTTQLIAQELFLEISITVYFAEVLCVLIFHCRAQKFLNIGDQS